MIGTGLLACAVLAQAPGSALDDHRAEIEGALQKIAQVEGVSLFIDLGDKGIVPEVPDQRFGGWTMTYLASLNDREWSESQSVQVFGRRIRSQPSIKKEGQLAVARILDSLSSDDLFDALNNGTSFASFPQRDRADLLSWAFNWPGVTQTSAYDDPHETMNAYRDSPNSTSVTITPMDKYVVEGPDGKVFEFYSSDSHKKVALHGATWSQPPFKQTGVFEVSPSPSDGQLDYGQGRIVTVRQILSESSRVFKKHYRVDPRLFDDLLFVSGRYTQERYEACMHRVLFLEPFRAVTESPEIGDLLGSLADKMRDVNPNLFENDGDSFPIQALETTDPAAYKRMIEAGFDPRTATVHVKPGFFLKMNPNTKILVGTEQRSVEGLPYTVVTKHRQIVIGIGF